jgi:hypothetical protein
MIENIILGTAIGLLIIASGYFAIGIALNLGIL